MKQELLELNREGFSIGEVLSNYFSRVSSQDIDIRIKEKSRKVVEFISLYTVIDVIVTDRNELHQFAYELSAVASALEEFACKESDNFREEKSLNANLMKNIAKDAENGTINNAYRYLYCFILNSWHALKDSSSTYRLLSIMVGMQSFLIKAEKQEAVELRDELAQLLNEVM